MKRIRSRARGHLHLNGAPLPLFDREVIGLQRSFLDRIGIRSYVGRTACDRAADRKPIEEVLVLARKVTVRAGLHSVLVGEVVTGTRIDEARDPRSDGDDGVDVAVLQR